MLAGVAAKEAPTSPLCPYPPKPASQQEGQQAKGLGAQALQSDNIGGLNIFKHWVLR